VTRRLLQRDVFNRYGRALGIVVRGVESKRRNRVIENAHTLSGRQHGHFSTGRDFNAAFVTAHCGDRIVCEDIELRAGYVNFSCRQHDLERAFAPYVEKSFAAQFQNAFIPESAAVVFDGRASVKNYAGLVGKRNGTYAAGIPGNDHR
jgi:hypothetical protein